MTLIYSSEKDTSSWENLLRDSYLKKLTKRSKRASIVLKFILENETLATPSRLSG